MAGPVAVPRDALRDSLATEKLHSLRDLLASANPEQLLDATIYAEAVAASARAREAHDLLVEAVELRIRAERRLGELVAMDNGMWESFPTLPNWCGELAEVPPRLFEKSLLSLLTRGKATGTHPRLAARSVISAARLLSLRKVEPQIWVAYDGSYFSRRSDGRWTKRIAHSIEAARLWVADYEPGSKRSRARIRLDGAYADSRFLASALSHLSRAFTGESRAAIQEGELLAAKVAESLDRARRLAL